MDLAIAILTGTAIAATPLILAALGELVAERCGMVNLGVEGMMLIGAAAAVVTVAAGFPSVLAIILAIAAGAASSLLYAVLVLNFMTNQYAAGLALTIMGSGLSALMARGLGAVPIQGIQPLHVPVLDALPVVGPLLFRFDPLVYAAWLLVAAVSWFLYRTKAGLVLRSVGESPTTAHALGYPVVLIRYGAVLFGGMTAGLAGAYLSIVYTPLWVENMTAGKGWIAVALVVFSTWRPARIVLGAWLFGGLTILQLQAQAIGLPIPSELLSTLPYLASIAVLVLISRNRKLLTANYPASLGKPYRTAG